MMNHTATVLDLAAQLSHAIAGWAAAAAVLVAVWSLGAAGPQRARLRAIPVRTGAGRPRS